MSHLTNGPVHQCLQIDQEVLSGQYWLQNVTGTGFQAIVYKAIDLSTNNFVAVKSATFGNSIYARSSIRKEAQVLAQIDHENIIRVQKVIEKGDKVYLVLEYINGKDICQYVANVDSISNKHKEQIVKDISKALKYIHRHGIFHNDLHIGNVMISVTGDVKLIDFGCSLFASDDKKLNRKAVKRDFDDLRFIKRFLGTM